MPSTCLEPNKIRLPSAASMKRERRRRLLRRLRGRVLRWNRQLRATAAEAEASRRRPQGSDARAGACAAPSLELPLPLPPSRARVCRLRAGSSLSAVGSASKRRPSFPTTTPVLPPSPPSRPRTDATPVLPAGHPVSDRPPKSEANARPQEQEAAGGRCCALQFVAKRLRHTRYNSHL